MRMLSFLKFSRESASEILNQPNCYVVVLEIFTELIWLRGYGDRSGWGMLMQIGSPFMNSANFRKTTLDCFLL